MARHEEWSGTPRMRRDGLGPRYRGDRAGDCRRAPLADPLQDDHRLWCAEQAARRQPKAPHWVRTSCGCDAPGIGLGLPPFEYSRRCHKSWREIRLAGAKASRRMAIGGLQASGKPRNSTPAWRQARCTACSMPYLDTLSPIRPRLRRARHRNGLEGDQRRIPATIGGSAVPDRIEQHQNKGCRRSTASNTYGPLHLLSIREFGMARGDERHGADGGVALWRFSSFPTIAAPRSGRRAAGAKVIHV